MIEKSVGVKMPIKNSNRGEFEEFLGVWSKSDAKSFEKSTCDFDIIQ